MDRIYLAAPSTLQVADEAAGRSVTLETRTLPDAVVWNPWVAKAASLPDFGARRSDVMRTQRSRAR